MNTMFADRIRLKDLEETLANSTPLLAVVGAGDLAVHRIRAAREQLSTRGASFDPKAFREQAQATILEGVEALQTEVQAAPEQLRALPERAQEWPAKAQALLADVMSTAFTTYGELAGRGKDVVQSVRRERGEVKPVQPVSRPAGSTGSATRKATTTRARKSGSGTSSSTTSRKTSTATKKAGTRSSGATKSASSTSPSSTSAASKPTSTKTTAVKSSSAKSTTGTSSSAKSNTGKPAGGTSTSAAS